ncbi:MAG TPA: phosphatase PAP2 family protein [Patescibacteria group bacterium]|nr:phosphatase PAP2 family protein [Patescibacteria group bacterium]
MNNIIVEFLASFFIYFLFFGLTILWVVDGKIKKEQVLHALFAAFIAWLITAIIKIIFPTLRPFRIEGLPVLTFTIPNDGSFPSGHTAEAFAVAVTVWLHDKKVGWLFLFAALLVGMARVWANVHYPIDILGGAFIGTIIAVVVEKVHLFDLFKSRK